MSSESFSSIDLDEKLSRIRDDIEQNTHFAYICVSDLRYHCKGNISRLTVPSVTDEHRSCEADGQDETISEDNTNVASQLKR